MRNITTLALCTLVLSGCTTNPNSPFASTELILQFRYAEGAAAPALYTRKNSPELENCSPQDKHPVRLLPLGNSLHLSTQRRPREGGD